METFPVTIYFSKSLVDINEGIEIAVSSDQVLQSISKIACSRAKIPYFDRFQFINGFKTPLSMLNSVRYNDIRKNTYLVLIDPSKLLFLSYLLLFIAKCYCDDALVLLQWISLNYIFSRQGQPSFERPGKGCLPGEHLEILGYCCSCYFRGRVDNFDHNLCR